MVLLSLWVGISSLPRLAAGGGGGRGSAGRREGLGLPSLSESRGRPPSRPTRLARGAERAKGLFAATARAPALLPPPCTTRLPPRLLPPRSLPRPHSAAGRAQEPLSFEALILPRGGEASKGNEIRRPTHRRSEMETSLELI